MSLRPCSHKLDVVPPLELHVKLVASLFDPSSRGREDLCTQVRQLYKDKSGGLAFYSGSIIFHCLMPYVSSAHRLVAISIQVQQLGRHREHRSTKAFLVLDDARVVLGGKFWQQDNPLGRHGCNILIYTLQA